MELFELGTSGIRVPSVVVGCMRMETLSESELEQLIQSAVEMGLNLFDHADIYGGGNCEEIFGRAVDLRSPLREKMLIQSKCGIASGMYDSSKEHILVSVDKILKRLNMEYLDVLLLHRPDALAEPEEIAEAFDQLERSGKVRNFGVSNHTAMQIQLLKKYVKQAICVNQMQLSLPHAPMISQGMEANMMTEGGINRDGGLLDYCRLHDVTIQAWSPFQYGFFEGVFIGSSKYPELNDRLNQLAKKYQVTETTIASAWILRHPAKIQIISGTTKIGRLKEINDARKIRLTREEWYSLYRAAGHILP